MFTVAVIGPDGAGKSTVTQQVLRRLDLPLKYIYMGVNLESSNLVLPTTRLILEVKRLAGGRPDMTGPPDPTRVKPPPPKNPIKRLSKEAKTVVRIGNLIAEEWYRQFFVSMYHRRGTIVLSDRHFFCDYYAHDIAVDRSKLPFMRRLHGFLLGNLYPRPDLLITLDAPAEVLFARKGEGTLDMLESRRQEYLRLREAIPHFATVDATQPLEDVVNEVTEIIWLYYRTRTGLAFNELMGVE
ncbi:MAG: hypothetical protein AAF614_18150 [Chloroflexota bacterium]